mmetsp:Transcript_43908/g.101496  ORF Transcript_43908/g.101496 Transcript_43908/m.101496 type:complete len:575 (-) Transcript_43908:154-1878(-)
MLHILLPLASLAMPMCVIPTGLDVLTGLTGFDGLAFPDNNTAFDRNHLMGNSVLLTVMLDVGVPALVHYETPIQARLALMHLIPFAGFAAAFHPTALEPFGRVDVSAARRRCGATVDYAVDKTANSRYLHRQVSLAYTVAWGVSATLPNADVAMIRSILAGWKLDYDICDKAGIDCTDISTPWGLARSMIDEQTDFFAFDGWNADGSYSREFNKRPYEDWRARPYVPKNTPFELTATRRWQPMTEENGLGYITNQQHVTPHIGWTGRPFVLTDADVCSARLANPEYDLPFEANLVIQRTSTLDDVKKIEIEFWDSKFTSLIPLLIQYGAAKGMNADDYNWIILDFATVVSIYDAVQLSWKVKVQTDLVRPTSYIQSAMADKTVNAYRGPGLKNGPIKGAEWEAYRRVMPHAEFPSGSSCICRAFVDAISAFEGSDTTQPISTGALLMDFPAGSSKTEPGIMPATDIMLEFETWDAVVDMCGYSRLNAGFHFTASIPGGEELCGIAGTKAGAYTLSLNNGVSPDSRPDINHRILTEADTRTCDSCPPGCEPGTPRRRLLFAAFMSLCPAGCVSVF